MATRKTWIWIVVGVVGLGLAGLMAAAGAGIYFVSHHIKTERIDHADALRTFDEVKAALADPEPLYTLDASEELRVVRPLSELPTSGVRPESLHLLAWDPDAERLARVSLPFWILRFGKGKLNVAGKDRDLNLERLELDPDELERVGPRLLFDVRHADGARVLLWTQ
jgi:hypothetical protein